MQNLLVAAWAPGITTSGKAAVFKVPDSHTGKVGVVGRCSAVMDIVVELSDAEVVIQDRGFQHLVLIKTIVVILQQPGTHGGGEFTHDPHFQIASEFGIQVINDVLDVVPRHQLHNQISIHVVRLALLAVTEGEKKAKCEK